MKVNTSQRELDISHMLKVSVEQFYGIECEDFPCQIAQVGMWLVDHQMNLEVSDRFGQYFARLPLSQSATIFHGNALRLDWESVVLKGELSYILGNPPFVGHQWRNAEQAEDMDIVYSNSGKYGKLDYVCSWYKKATDYMAGTKIQAAFVSTNSICQGESVSTMWEPLFAQGIEITFAYHSFFWSNEAKGKAAVNCIIVGFAVAGIVKVKQIYGQDAVVEASNINGYLLPAPNIFIQSRGKPLTPGIPEMSKGSQPTDGENLIFSSTERDGLISKFPQAEKWIKRYMSGKDFINNTVRYCLWLKDIAPSEYRAIRPIMNRLEKVSESRKRSPTASVRRDADKPMLFTQIRQPSTMFLALPVVSSEKRKYIPIGYLEPDIIASDQIYIVPNGSLQLFAILTSSVHMVWSRVICGRLEMRYRYSPAIYNNFPWPEVSDMQKAETEKLAQAILDSRALFPESSLADLYDPLTMPPELLKAHSALDKAVMGLYGFAKGMTEADIVAKLMELYRGMAGP